MEKLLWVLATILSGVLTILSPFAILFLAYATRDLMSGGYQVWYNLLLFMFAVAIPMVLSALTWAMGNEI